MTVNALLTVSYMWLTFTTLANESKKDMDCLIDKLADGRITVEDISVIQDPAKLESRTATKSVVIENSNSISNKKQKLDNAAGSKTVALNLIQEAKSKFLEIENKTMQTKERTCSECGKLKSQYYSGAPGNFFTPQSQQSGNPYIQPNDQQNLFSSGRQVPVNPYTQANGPQNVYSPGRQVVGNPYTQPNSQQNFYSQGGQVPGFGPNSQMTNPQNIPNSNSFPPQGFNTPQFMDLSSLLPPGFGSFPMNQPTSLGPQNTAPYNPTYFPQRPSPNVNYPPQTTPYNTGPQGPGSVSPNLRPRDSYFTRPQQTSQFISQPTSQIVNPSNLNYPSQNPISPVPQQIPQYSRDPQQNGPPQSNPIPPTVPDQTNPDPTDPQQIPQGSTGPQQTNSAGPQQSNSVPPPTDLGPTAPQTTDSGSTIPQKTDSNPTGSQMTNPASDAPQDTDSMPVEHQNSPQSPHPGKKTDGHHSGDPLGGLRILCLFNNKHYYKNGFTPAQLEPHLCTHLNYEFAIMDPTTYEMMTGEPYLDVELRFYEEAVGLKKINPKLKVMMSLGGWSDSTKKYSEMADDPAKRENFIKKAVPFLQGHGFDGMDLAWEYPNCWQGALGVSPKDKDNFVTLLKEIKQEFEKNNLLLSVSVGAIKREVDAAYDVPEISKTVDYINVMTYDMHGPWEHKTGHHVQFEPLPDDKDKYCNVKGGMQVWIEKGASKKKLNMGLAFYARTCKMNDATQCDLGLPAPAPGDPGPITKEGGILSYHEICNFLNSGNWTEKVNRHAGYYACSGDQFAAYDNPMMMVNKTRFVVDYGLGGVLVKDLSGDDSKGECFNMPFPLLKMVKLEMMHRVRHNNMRKSR